MSRLTRNVVHWCLDWFNLHQCKYSHVRLTTWRTKHCSSKRGSRTADNPNTGRESDCVGRFFTDFPKAVTRPVLYRECISFIDAFKSNPIWQLLTRCDNILSLRTFVGSSGGAKSLLRYWRRFQSRAVHYVVSKIFGLCCGAFTPFIIKSFTRIREVFAKVFRIWTL